MDTTPLSTIYAYEIRIFLMFGHTGHSGHSYSKDLCSSQDPLKSTTLQHTPIFSF